MDFVQRRPVGGGLESFGAEGFRERALVRAGCLSFFSALAALGISGAYIVLLGELKKESSFGNAKG
jgi:hypothetical protein